MLEEKPTPDKQPSASVSYEDYQRAESFLPHNIGKLVFRLSIIPHWLADSDAFWYRVHTRTGPQFIYVDPATGERRQAFDHVRLAAALSRATHKAYVHNDLPFSHFEYIDEGTAVEFAVDGSYWRCDLTTYEIEPAAPPLTPDLGTAISPDGQWTAFVRDHNLYLRATADDSEVQLTSDGQAGCHYAAPLPNPLLAAGLQAPSHWSSAPAIVWSPDSQKILTYKIDTRGVGECFLVRSVPADGSKRPELYRYLYPLPGDEAVPQCEPMIIDIKTKAIIPLQLPSVPQLYYGAPRCWVYWTQERQRDSLYFLHRRRGNTVRSLYMVDTATGASQELIREESPTAVENYSPRAIDDGRLILWRGQQDGWAHLYLYDGLTGELQRQLTRGPWVVRSIEHVDESNRFVYFTASGREDGRDPYYRRLYRISFDGSRLQLLTPEDAEHEITFAPSGQYFVDRYSRIDLAPVTVLRQADGALVMQLEEADLDLLLATGWTFPERFSAKARDGINDVYGMIIRPSNFDPSKTYPVIEANYSGPHTIRTPKAFAASEASRQFWQDQAIAELGFIVVTVDGLGMAHRSKAWQDVSYRNLADGGFPDHIAALRQLAQRYPYLDLDRVGIYGGSAGGYAAAQAILAYPDFYKVAVVWAGNHDHRIDKASWVERYMGLPVGAHYEEQANPTLAANLQGKLLIMHGEMDENVPPAASLQLADALIKANKDFDFLILPGGVHASGYHPYITRRRWDYFVRHLLGAVPPKEYNIQG